MQKILRVMIIIAMLITAYLLILAWRDDYADATPVEATPNAVTSVGADIPSTTGAAGDIPIQTVPTADNSVAAPVKDTGLITVTTDRYDIKINPEGGDIVYAALKQYNATLDSDQPFVLLENDSNRVYIAQSGLIGANGIDTADGRANYSHTASSYVMTEGQQTLVVPLTYQKDGVTITKTFTFTHDKYPIDVSYQIQNQSANPWQGQLFAQLKRDASKDPGMSDKGALSMATYLGGAWGTPDEPYNKLKFNNFSDSELTTTTSDSGWVGIVQHYFVSAWTPENFTGNFFSRETAGEYFIGFNSQPINIAANKQATLTATLYAGPKVQSELKDVAVGLNQTVDYGLLWPISKILFAILDGIHKIIGNWGWSIILLTILVKIALMWFSNKSYYSMAKMRAIAPRLAALKEEHGDDRMKMSQAMMGIYKEEKVNPMAGCLPILMQMPIFLALYWVLVESVELRHAPWILWINDLSAMDPWFILPLLMGASMFIQQQLNPQPTDPMQAKVMKFLPIIFTAFMLFFPAGLVLYWTLNNLFSMTQQYLINQKVEKEQKHRTVKVLEG